jgi:L-ascorbate metabolism protein UlaG (beta-lactamase superfamily)
MQVEWYGQSAFRLSDEGTTIFIDPFDDLGALRDRGMRWEYPAISSVRPDLVLVTHEHRDHNGIGALDGDAPVLRSTAGKHASRLAEAARRSAPAQAAEIAATSGARIIVPMHYRTERVDFLEPVDDFLARAARVERVDAPVFDTDALPSGSDPLVVVPAAP